MKRAAILGLALAWMSGCASLAAQHHASCAAGDLSACTTPELGAWCDRGLERACIEYGNYRQQQMANDQALPNQAAGLVGWGLSR